MKLIDILEKYCERIEKELEDQYKKIEKLNPLPPGELDISDKLLHALKSVKTVLAMLEYDEDEDDGGYSGKYYSGPYYARRNMTRGGYSGRNDGGRDYSGRRGYSRDSEKDDMVRRLESMMSRVRSDEEAQAINDALDVLERMK